MVTPHRFHRRLVALGLPLTESGDYYGYSLALGSADVSLLSLTNAYRSFANRGAYGPVRMTVDGAPVTRQPVIEPGGELCDWRCAGRPQRAAREPSASTAC